MTKEMIDAVDDIKVAKKGRLHEYKNDKGELPYNISSCSGCFTRKYLTSQLHTALFLFQSASAHAAPHLDSPFFLLHCLSASVSSRSHCQRLSLSLLVMSKLEDVVCLSRLQTDTAWQRLQCACGVLQLSSAEKLDCTVQCKICLQKCRQFVLRVYIHLAGNCFRHVSSTVAWRSETWHVAAAYHAAVARSAQSCCQH